MPRALHTWEERADVRGRRSLEGQGVEGRKVEGQGVEGRRAEGQGVEGLCTHSRSGPGGGLGEGPEDWALRKGIVHWASLLAQACFEGEEGVALALAPLLHQLDLLQSKSTRF